MCYIYVTLILVGMLLLFGLDFLGLYGIICVIRYVSFSWFANMILLRFFKFVCYYLCYIYVTLILVGMLLLFGLDFLGLYGIICVIYMVC